MSKSITPEFSLLISAIVVALSMVQAATVAPPSRPVAIMNAHSDLCLSPAGGGGSTTVKSSNSHVTKIRRAFGVLRSSTATWSRSPT